VIKLIKEKRIFWLFLISFFLLLCVFGAQVNASVAAFSEVILVEENYLTAQDSTAATSSENSEVGQTVSRSFQGNLSGTITKTMQGEQQQILRVSSFSNSVWFSRHLMCRDHDHDYNPIEPTTIFRPSDIKAVCLTTISTDDTNVRVHSIQFRWHYRSNSSKTWVSCHNVSGYFSVGGPYIEQRYQCYFSIAGYWPGNNYPRAYKVEVYLDDSPSPSFSEFFEVTNGGLNSPRMCENVENGKPVSMKSRFTIDVDTEAYHYLRFDKIAYFNEELEYCHNFTTVWIQPNGSTYKTHAVSFPDYKDTNVTWNYWEYRYTQADYISINPSTPIGNWRVEVYLDSYYFNNTWVRYGPIATTPFVVGTEPAPNWTFMVYLDADIDIIGTENASIEIFLRMANVSSSPQVNIVVQMDRIPGHDSRYGDWTDCKRFNVSQGMTPTPGNSTLDLGEVNMGHPDTLKDFVNWTISNFPANYYSLVLWDHGAGCMGICFDFFDETGLLSPIAYLSLPELSQALSGLPAVMDLVFLDACSMSMTEVAYQIKDCANVLVSPEGLGIAMVDSRAAPYDDYLSSLISNPFLLPEAFATDVVTKYIDWCINVDAIDNATMSAIDLTEITSLTATIHNFSLKLKEKEILYHEETSLARNLTAGYIGPFGNQCGYYIDLYHFAQLIYQYVPDEELRNTADQAMTTLESIIIMEAQKARPDSHGLSIFFPDEENKYNNYDSLYEETTFTEDTAWDEFVKYHLDIQASGCILTIETPYSGILVDFDEESYTTDDEGKLRVFVLPDSYNVSVPTLVPSPVETGPGSRGVFTKWNDGETNSSRTIPVTVSTTYTVYYETQYEVTFGQSGVGTDFEEAVVTIDDKEYNATNLPVSFWWDNGTIHNFSFQSPLVVIPNTKRYIWNSTSGLSSLQSGPITVGKSGNVIGNYETQYYLTLATSPPDAATTSGEGWYYNGTDASVSTDEFVDITAEASRYRFNGWTTTDMPEISDPNSSSTTVRIDRAKTVTANYLIQYYFLVVSSYDSPTPTSGWFDSGTAITASVTSPWPLEATDTRYACTGWTGTGSVSTSGTNISVTFTINALSSITWNWKIQYLLTVRTDPTGICPLPNVSPLGTWFDKDTTVNCTAQEISGRVFDYWTVDGARWDPGVNPITVTMDGSYEATAHYVGERAWWEILFDLDWLNFVIALVGLVAPVALVGFAWVRNRRKKAVIKALLNRIDEVYSRFKTKPRKCEEELRGLRNKITEDLTDGKITQENYDIMDKKIEKYMEELRKK
jgi:hypothetical protein